jgi:hypothetical protein
MVDRAKIQVVEEGNPRGSTFFLNLQENITKEEVKQSILNLKSWF